MVSEGLAATPQAALERLQGLSPGRRVCCLKQVHGREVVDAAALVSGQIPEADGLVSADPTDMLVVRTADCVPVLAWDSREKIRGALHAGWRGLALDINLAGIEAMRRLGADDIHVAIGPAIGPCCYAVGDEVVDALGAQFCRRENGRTFMDLWQKAFSQLINAGIAPQNITVNRICTNCNAEIFFSYRRDRDAAGRNYNIIGGGPWSLPGLRAG